MKKRAEEHDVKHIFSGKAHFFEVTSKSGEQYNVSVKVGCTCRYMSLQGISNSQMCSHVLSALKKIVEEAEINHNERKNRGRQGDGH